MSQPPLPTLHASTHVPFCSTSPVGQTHWPELHERVPHGGFGHTFPQLPQLLTSLLVSMHVFVLFASLHIA
jgi:hypothetical protein